MQHRMRRIGLSTFSPRAISYFSIKSVSVVVVAEVTVARYFATMRSRSMFWKRYQIFIFIIIILFYVI